MIPTWRLVVVALTIVALAWLHDLLEEMGR